MTHSTANLTHAYYSAVIWKTKANLTVILPLFITVYLALLVSTKIILQ